MSLNIQLNPNDSISDEECNLHLMPCKINHNGPANVKEFFSPYIHKRDLHKNTSVDSSEILESSFRGYPLQGVKIVIPTSYKGIVINETKKPLTDIEERKLQSVKNFSEFTYWNWDDIPTSNGSMQQLLDWMLLSKVIHGKD